jgi:hypothetical protein
MGILVRFRPDGMFFRELLLEAVVEAVFDEAAFEDDGLFIVAFFLYCY